MLSFFLSLLVRSCLRKEDLSREGSFFYGRKLFNKFLAQFVNVNNEY